MPDKTKAKLTRIKSRAVLPRSEEQVRQQEKGYWWYIAGAVALLYVAFRKPSS